MDFEKLKAVIEASPLGASIYSITRGKRIYSNSKSQLQNSIITQTFPP